jgi:predicted GH43/DUF377 family glycosyl hydrolase
MLADSDIMTYSSVLLHPDPSRTVIRPFAPDDPAGFVDEVHPRAQRIADRIVQLDDEHLQHKLKTVVASLAERHRDVEDLLDRRFHEVNGIVIDRDAYSREQQLLIGAYFSEEYSFEAAALFNPSVVIHRDQSGLPSGSVRFVMSLRGIGEGHVSSVTFRRGVWRVGGAIEVEKPSAWAVPPRIEKSDDDNDDDTIIKLFCEASRDVSETVLFPITPSQRQGIEDVRIVRFEEEDGDFHYLGTYTAYSGTEARSELLRAADFRTFEMRALRGKVVGGKGLALFPRRVGGRLKMLGRQDNESIWLLTSDDLYEWNEAVKLVSPRYPWEFIQMGNCGSPIELDEGWLVLTHGVGMVRNYCIGACLLDKDDPSKLLARTPAPLIEPSGKARNGYVPNVVYSCGGLVHERTLLLPYGVADNYATFATAPVDKILAAME